MYGFITLSIGHLENNSVTELGNFHMSKHCTIQYRNLTVVIITTDIFKSEDYLNVGEPSSS